MKALKHLPNLLTITRILLCPAVLVLLFSHRFITAFSLFLAAALTDMLDGFLARRLNAASLLGSFLDPIADKFLLLSFQSALMVLQLCSPWFVALSIAILLLQFLGLVFFHSPKPSSSSNFSPLWAGKWNTCLQLLWVGYLLLVLAIYQGKFPPFLLLIHPVAYSVLAACQVGVFLIYFFHYRVHLTPEARTFFPIHPSR